MHEQLSWSYERDACWGPSGEPLLSAWLRSDDLMLRLRNSREYGLEVAIAVQRSGTIDEESPGAAVRLGFHGGAPQPLAVRVQGSRDLAFVQDVRWMVAQLNCADRLQLHVRPSHGGVWWTLDASTDDLQLERLMELPSGIVLRYAHAAPARRTPAPRSSGAAHAPTAAPVAASAPAAARPEDAAMADLMGAIAPLAAMVAGAKLGHWLTSPDKRR